MISVPRVNNAREDQNWAILLASRAHQYPDRTTTGAQGLPISPRRGKDLRQKQSGQIVRPFDLRRRLTTDVHIPHVRIHEKAASGGGSVCMFCVGRAVLYSLQYVLLWSREPGLGRSNVLTPRGWRGLPAGKGTEIWKRTGSSVVVAWALRQAQ